MAPTANVSLNVYEALTYNAFLHSNIDDFYASSIHTLIRNILNMIQ